MDTPVRVQVEYTEADVRAILLGLAGRDPAWRPPG